jgi:hypothetical protein
MNAMPFRMQRTLGDAAESQLVQQLADIASMRLNRKKGMLSW